MVAESRFPEWYQARAASLGWRRVDDLNVALAAWSDFVDQCAHGYTFSIEEYDDDRSVRDALQLAYDEEAKRLAGSAEVRSRVDELDARFRTLLQPGVTIGPEGAPWWQTGVLKRAGAALVADVDSQYGIAMENVLPGNDNDL